MYWKWFKIFLEENVTLRYSSMSRNLLPHWAKVLESDSFNYYYILCSSSGLILEAQIWEMHLIQKPSFYLSDCFWFVYGFPNEIIKSILIPLVISFIKWVWNAWILIININTINIMNSTCGILYLFHKTT